MALWNLFTDIPAPIIGSFITGMMTLTGVVIGQYAINRREERKEDAEVEAVKDALAVELRTHDEWLEWLLYVVHDIDRLKENSFKFDDKTYEEAFESDLNARISLIRYAADHRVFPCDVYESNTDKIGKLEPLTSEHIVNTYNRIRNLSQQLEKFQSSIDYEALSLSTEIDWSTGAGLPVEVQIQITQIEETVARAMIFQKLTLTYLGDRSSESDRAAVAFAITNLNPKSEEMANTKQYLEDYMKKYDIASIDELVNEDATHRKASK